MGLASFDTAGRSDDVGCDLSPEDWHDVHVMAGEAGATDTEGSLNNIQ